MANDSQQLITSLALAMITDGACLVNLFGIKQRDSCNKIQILKRAAMGDCNTSCINMPKDTMSCPLEFLYETSLLVFYDKYHSGAP